MKWPTPPREESLRHFARDRIRLLKRLPVLALNSDGVCYLTAIRIEVDMILDSRKPTRFGPEQACISAGGPDSELGQAAR